MRTAGARESIGVASRRLATLGGLLLVAGLCDHISAQGQDVVSASAPARVLDAYAPALDGVEVTEEIVELGRDLFNDPRLSRDRTLTCAGCHQPDRAFADGGQVAKGVEGRVGPRNVPTLVNRAYGRHFSWDGRGETLLEQVLLPIENPLELDVPVATVIERLAGDPGMRDAFGSAFGGGPSRSRLTIALTAYVASIRSDDAPFDRHFLGDASGLTAEERAGRRVFLAKGRCHQCHLGPNLTDESFHVTGIAWRSGTADDLGRFALSGDSTELGAFKTPTLREVGRTAPYMHDGSIGTLEEVVDFYDGGGIANPYLDERLHPLQLSDDEKRALVAFLRALSGTVRDGPAASGARGSR